MMSVFTGHGKGKTTAALGQAMRAVGEGKTVLMLQFIKGPWKSGEDEAVKVFGDKFRIIKGGKGFVGILGDTLPRSVHRRAARALWVRSRRAIERREADVIILDELNNALALKLLPGSEVVQFLKRVKKDREIIVTGRDAPKQLLQIADLVSEVREVKHYYQKGILARRGIEF
ncbi:cob(I)yrinic acid a,c-diamide adenosyltransferase [Candidatus Parcubacteria bacterium]|nr:cob(I)yrinic acid a,c-diamide adenosyltransferase [Candidatus Parcubacteria bacterium]